MNRIVSVSLIVALLVIGGLWLSRSQEQEEAETETSPEETVVVGPDLPEGFSVTPFLSEEPQRAFEGADEVLEPATDYQAIIETNKGTMRIDLYEDGAPMTVNNFVFLARNHYYDGVVFHRVLEDFMAQTGDPTGTGRGGPGYQFDNEVSDELLHDERGIVSMANAGPDTNGSQFFITFGPTPQLDGSYNVFGEVVEGEEVLDAITRIDPQNPSAIVGPEDTLQTLSEQGIALAGEANTTISAYLEDKLGALPPQGDTFDVDGYTAVSGSRGGETAYGFFPQPDRMESVTVIERPRND